jgi:anaerobic magnesium-protoporphyrin IX monomethyl ester cyclase
MGKRKARVLLLSPNLKGLNDGINRIQPGMGIASLAAVLRQDGHEVYVRDTALEGYDNRALLPDGRTVLIGETDNQIAEYIKALQPDIVGISVVFSNLADSARHIARIVKAVKPDTHTVIGGNHVTNAYKDFFYATSGTLHTSLLKEVFLRDINEESIDYAMVGEADFEFPKLVDFLVNGTQTHAIKNLVYKDRNNEIKMTSEPLSRTVVRNDIDSLPHPAWDLFNMKRYFEIGAFQSPRTNAEKILPLMVSRGCPEVCTFCTTPDTWGMRLRWKDPGNIRSEIQMAIALFDGIDEVQLVDDNITANLRGLYQLCEVLEEFGIRWCTPNGTKANYHIAKQLSYYNRMKQSGCYQITIACESGNQRVMDNIVRKKLKLYEIAKSVENAKNAGLFVHTFWIAGFPGETRDDMEETIAFAASIGADSYSVAILSPLPGTPVYREVVERQLWWPQGGGLDNMTYRSSLVKVDGFDGPEEFESWVNKQNIRLNELLGKKDPRRMDAYEKLRDEALRGKNIQQT